MENQGTTGFDEKPLTFRLTAQNSLDEAIAMLGFPPARPASKGKPAQDIYKNELN